MAFILTSRLGTHRHNKDGSRTPIKIRNKNKILTNIKKNLRAKNRLVWVCNNPDDTIENDIRSNLIFKSFDLTFKKESFKEKIVLDSRNKSNTKEILESADIIILSGGKCLCQQNFFNEIHLKNILKNFKGVVIGTSAGTMNLCKTVANFPEEPADLEEPRWFEGLGFCDEIIIPHFDGKTKTYQIPLDEIDIVNDYILPMSKEKDFLGIPNDSYLLIDAEGNEKLYGKCYKISKGEVTRIKKSKMK